MPIAAAIDARQDARATIPPCPPPPPPPPALPLDAEGILALAARSMFHLFSSISQGMFLVDRSGRIVWINEGYKRFLPALGFSSVDEFVGHLVEDVVPNTQMRHVLETGEPILIDLLTNKAGTFVVSRIPLRDEQSGEVIGAIGIVLFDHPETTLQPLISKFAPLQRDLDDARRELASAAPLQVHLRQLHRQQPGGGGGQAPGAARGAVVQPGAAAGRDRHRQGTAGACDPRGLGARRAARSSASTSRPCPTRCWRPSSSASRPAPTPAPTARARDGKFKLADGGTLFLDEIGDMPLGLQAKLLRALQEGEIEPLGSNKVVPFDARVIAATSRDLRGAGARRALSRRPVLPAQRAADPRAAAARAARRHPGAGRGAARGHGAAQRRGAARAHARCAGAAGARSTGAATSASCATCWSRRRCAATRSASTRAQLERSPARGRHRADRAAPHAAAAARAEPARRPALLRPLAEQVAELERQAIAAALAATGGNKLAAARLLGISRATLYERLENPV